MKGIVWKGFKLGDLFEWSRRWDLSMKEYKEYQEYEEGLVEVVKGSNSQEKNFYYKIADLPDGYPIYKNCLVLNANGSIGFSFYYEGEIVSPTSSVHILLHKNKRLEKLMNKMVNLFFAKMITKIFANGIFNRVCYLIDNNKFNREIILLPCTETSNSEDWTFEIDGKFYSLAVDYIEQLMCLAEESKNKKLAISNACIKSECESEIQEWIPKREEIKSLYLNEKKNVCWIPFKLGDLFERSTTHSIDVPKKGLDEVEVQDEQHTIRNITAGKTNNGCSGYLVDEGDIREKKKINYLTLSMNGASGGVCFFQNSYFVSSGDNNLLEIKNPNFKKVLDSNYYCYLFLAKIISYILRPDGVNRFLRKVSNDFDREILLLPCIEVEPSSNYVFEHDGHYYTLASNYINYMYMTSKIKYNNKIIESISEV